MESALYRRLCGPRPERGPVLETKTVPATPRGSSMTIAPTFKTVLEVERYLNLQDYRIKKSAIYNHVHAGKLVPAIDGGFTLAEVERYARNNLKKTRRKGFGIHAGLPLFSEARLAALADEKRFKNVVEIQEYLNAEGWKVKKSTIYNHIKAHRLWPDIYPHFSQFQVDRYAVRWLKKTDGSDTEEFKTAVRQRKIKIRRQQQKNLTETISDSYIRKKLSRMGFAIAEITPEMMELKRQQLTAHRTLQQFKKWRNEHESGCTDVQG